MKTPPARKTSQAKKGSATRVVRRRAVEVEDDDDTMVKKMVKSLHQDLSREIKRSHQKPINFYEFVCDPTSFADGVAVREDVDDADPDKRNPQQISGKTIEPDNEFEDDKSGNKDNAKAREETPMEADGDLGGGSGDKAKNETAAA